MVFSKQVSSFLEVEELAPICYSWSKIVDSPQAVGAHRFCIAESWMDGTVKEKRMFGKEFVS